MKLYKYTGTISEVSFRNRTACDKSSHAEK